MNFFVHDPDCGESESARSAGRRTMPTSCTGCDALLPVCVSHVCRLALIHGFELRPHRRPASATWLLPFTYHRRRTLSTHEVLEVTAGSSRWRNIARRSSFDCRRRTGIISLGGGSRSLTLPTPLGGVAVGLGLSVVRSRYRFQGCAGRSCNRVPADRDRRGVRGLPSSSARVCSPAAADIVRQWLG